MQNIRREVSGCRCGTSVKKHIQPDAFLSLPITNMLLRSDVQESVAILAHQNGSLMMWNGVTEPEDYDAQELGGFRGGGLDDKSKLIFSFSVPCLNIFQADPPISQKRAIF